MRLTLPWPPRSGNHQHGQRSGKRYLTPDVRAYRAEVWALLARVSRPEGRVGLRFTLYPPDRRARDGDNVLKVVMDALVAGGWLPDDSNKTIAWLTYAWAEPVKGGRIEVEVSCASERT